MLPAGDHAADSTVVENEVICVSSARVSRVIVQSWVFHTNATRLPSGLTAGLVALSPTQVYFSQEARAYMLMMLVVVAMLAAVS